MLSYYLSNAAHTLQHMQRILLYILVICIFAYMPLRFEYICMEKCTEQSVYILDYSTIAITVTRMFIFVYTLILYNV